MFRQGQTHTPPSPLSSRHSSQESLHKNAVSGVPRDVSAAAVAAAAAAQKKKGIKSSLGRFFSKKEKVIDIFVKVVASRFSCINIFLKVKGKDVGDSNLNLSQSSIGMNDGELSDSMSISSKLGQKGDFDRRQKKK